MFGPDQGLVPSFGKLRTIETHGRRHVPGQVLNEHGPIDWRHCDQLAYQKCR